MSSNKQVFQADNPGRWNRFKWLSRFLIIIFVVGVVAAVVTVTSTIYPAIPDLNPTPKKLSKKELEELKKSKQENLCHKVNHFLAWNGLTIKQTLRLYWQYLKLIT